MASLPFYRPESLSQLQNIPPFQKSSGAPLRQAEEAHLICCFECFAWSRKGAQRYLKSSGLQITIFILAGDKEIADGSGKVHPQRMCHSSWESVRWTAVKEKLAQHLNFSKIFPESFPCKFNYAHKEVLLKQYNLQAAKFQPEKCLGSGEMSHFENVCPLDYYQVAILGK